MRRINVLTGIKERINDLLGRHADEQPDDINDWSVQANMLENFRRVGLALTHNNAAGCVLRGLGVTPITGSIHISKGVGVTKGGHFINVSEGFTINDTYKNISDIQQGDSYLVLHYALEKVPENPPDQTGHSSDIHNSNSSEIVYDEYTNTASVSDWGSENNLSSGGSFVTLETSLPSDDYSLVIARINYDDEEAGSYIFHKNWMTPPGIGGDLDVDGKVTCSDVSVDTNYTADGEDGVTGSFTDNDGNTITVTGGIITGLS